MKKKISMSKRKLAAIILFAVFAVCCVLCVFSAFRNSGMTPAQARNAVAYV